MATAPATAQQPPLTYYAGPSKLVLPLTRAADGKLFVAAAVQGQPARLLIDTGGTQFLDLGFCQRLGLKLADSKDPGFGLGGAPVAVKTSLADLKLGNLSITAVPVACIDFGLLQDMHRRQGFPHFDGILGSDQLTLLRGRIDFDKLTLELRRPTRASMAEEMRRRAAAVTRP